MPRHPLRHLRPDGRPVTPAQAKAIIAGRWTVPPEIRARRRSKKAGKAPHKVPGGQCARGGLPLHITPSVTSGLASDALDNGSSKGISRP